MQYDITTHPMLSTKSKARFTTDPDQFEALADLSEALLGLRGTNFQGEDEATAELASAVQVNFMIAQDIDPFIYYSVNNNVGQNRNAVYRGYKNAPIIDPRAQVLASLVIEGITEPLTSVRSRD